MRHFRIGTAWKWTEKACGAAVLAAAIGIALPASAGATTIALTPAASTIAVGDTLVLSVDVTDAQALFLFQFGVSFDPLIFSAFAPQPRPFLDTSSGFFSSGCPFNSCAAPPGAVTAISGFGTLTDPLATAGTLATLSFLAIAPAPLTPSLFALTFADPGDGLFESIDDPFTGLPVLFPLSFTQSDALVTVNPAAAVPEPATVLLLGFTLLATVIMRRRVRLVPRPARSILGYRPAAARR